jgi:hypothetical protein
MDGPAGTPLDAADRQRLEQRASKLGLPPARRHILLCCDQTNPKCCDRDRSLIAWEYLKERLRELGLSERGGIARTKANCLRICEEGPIAVVYPEGTWYARCDPPDPGTPRRGAARRSVRHRDVSACPAGRRCARAAASRSTLG